MENKCMQLIAEQQGTQKNHVYWLGEHLKDICRTTPGAWDLVAVDLEMPSKSLTDLEKEINANAKKNGGCSPFPEADKIVREFYGLPLRDEVPTPAIAEPAPTVQRNALRLTDFL